MHDPEPTQDPFHLCGSTIEGKYAVASVIGDGGFGVVYRGVHKGFGEAIAIKCLKIGATLSEKDRDSLLEQLQEEGRLLHRLSRLTSGIVQALDVGAFTTAAGVWVPYLVLEWLEGETLGQYLRGRMERGEHGMTLRQAVELLGPAARALAVAHAQNVAHRDVKPANLFVTEVGGVRTLKVLDFGIAKVLTAHPSFTEALAATKLGPTAFTPRYGAPEQFNKQRGASGPWTDVFALALIFVELVTGRKALEGDDPTELYIAAADPMMRPTPKARGADIAEPVERVLEKALSVEPKHRYTDAGEFWNALQEAMNRLPASSTGQQAQPKMSQQPDAATAEFLSTAEYVSHHSLDVTPGGKEAKAPKSVEPASAGAASGGIHPALDATVPADTAATLAKPAAAKPGVVSSRAGASGAAGAAVSAGQRPIREHDPMAETPLGARSARGEPHGGRPTGDPASKTPATPPADAPASQSSADKPRRPVWPWLLGALMLGGGSLLYTLLTPVTPPRRPQPAPSTAPAHTTGPKASRAPSAGPAESAAPAASAVPSASASSEPGLPPVPPADMLYFPPATVLLGLGDTAREVTLTRGFFLERTEVTVRAYQACMLERQCSAADRVVLPPGGPVPPQDELGGTSLEEFAATWSRRCNEPRKALDQPINCVDYRSAESYCRARGRRLPTEAEWEFAARGTEVRVFPWGLPVPECATVCYDRNGDCLVRGKEVSTCSSGAQPGDRTPEGLYDMGGNVAEWVADGFAFAPLGGTDPVGDPSSQQRVIRGGSFLNGAEQLQATFRRGAPPATAHVDIGFRCAMDVPP